MPEHAPFPTDRRSLVRYVRAFTCLLAERLQVGHDISLPGRLTLDHILCSIAKHEANWDVVADYFQLLDDEGEPEWLAEIADTLRGVLDDHGEQLRGSSPSLN